MTAMRLWQIVKYRIRSVCRRSVSELDLDEELRYFLDEREQHYLAGGMSVPEARQAARRDIGSLAVIKDACRDAWRVRLWDDLARDLKDTVRRLRKAPAFTLTIVVVLALGIGANAAIFSIVHRVVLAPLPFAEPSRLMAIESWVRESGPEEGDSVAYLDFLDWRAQSSSVFDGMAAFTTPPRVALTGAGETAGIQAAAVAGDLFRVLGVAPLAGRPLTPEDDADAAPAVIVISESLWSDKFSRDPAVIGRALTIDRKSYTVVGVMPAAFNFPIQTGRIDVWAPIAKWPLIAMFARERGAHFLETVARLRSDRTIAEAQAVLSAIAARLDAAYPKTNARRVVGIGPLQDRVARNYRLALLVLLAAVAVVLLIACANVANLLLARSAARRHEMAVRLALGASRARLVRALLTESLLLALAAGIAGVVIASLIRPALLASVPVQIPRLDAVRIDVRVFLFSALMSIATAIVFGLAPAMQLSQAAAGDALTEHGRHASHRGTVWTRHGLIVGEVALSLVLVAGAGLLLRTLLHLQRLDTGFAIGQTLTVDLSIPETRYPNVDAVRRMYREMLDRVGRVPGVRSRAMATILPLSGNNFDVNFRPEGMVVDRARRPLAQLVSISPDYFATMGIQLLQGRIFSERDTDSGPRVVVINETMARRYWPGVNAVGRAVAVNDDGLRQIVGVVADVKATSLTEASSVQVYTPYPQMPLPFLSLIVRTDVPPATVAGPLRAALAAVDPDQAVAEIGSIEAFVNRSLAAPRFNASLVSTFAAFALLLAGIGLYGVTTYAVAQREREFGIRVALGASPSDIRSLVISQALQLGGVGFGIGLVASAASARLISGLLFGIGALDVPTFAATSALMLTILLVAAYLPARRATRVDPAITLRAE